jgi:hypothetical protein
LAGRQLSVEGLAAGEGVLLSEFKDWGALFLSEIWAAKVAILHLSKFVLTNLMVGSVFLKVKDDFILSEVVNVIREIHVVRDVGVVLLEAEGISHGCE